MIQNLGLKVLRDASIHEGQETTKVSKELFNFDSLEVIGALQGHTPDNHVCTPLTKDTEGKLLDCPCIPELIGKVDIQQLTSHLNFLATRSRPDDIQPKWARLENSGKNLTYGYNLTYKFQSKLNVTLPKDI